MRVCVCVCERDKNSSSKSGVLIVSNSVCVCVYVCVCARALVCVCVCARARSCVCVCVWSVKVKISKCESMVGRKTKTQAASSGCDVWCLHVCFVGLCFLTHYNPTYTHTRPNTQAASSGRDVCAGLEDLDIGSVQWVMSHVNASCHMRMGHVTYEWVVKILILGQFNDLCHITYGWVMSHMKGSCNIWIGLEDLDIGSV